MNNADRRQQITVLKETISPLDHEKFMASLGYNFRLKAFKENSNTVHEKLMLQYAETINNLNERLTPLYKKLRDLQIRYLVEYEGNILEEGRPSIQKHQEEFWLSTDFDLDTNEDFDSTHPDFNELVRELSQFIFSHQYSNGTITRIRKL